MSGTADAHCGADGPERTEDGRYVIVSGRRWRASDPDVPETLRTQLVGSLMAARRAVRAEGDAARHRVHDAKLALGERGEPWWEEPTPQGLATRAAATARALLRGRDVDSSLCPSEVARVVGGSRWRDRMDAVRAVAFDLAESGELRVLQGGRPVERGAGGPIRIGRGPDFPA